MKRELSNIAEQNKEKFKLFMQLIGLSERSLLNYANDVLNCSDLIADKLKEKGFANLYEVTDQEQARYFQQLLETNSEFIRHNQTGNNRYSASIVNYLKYVDFLFVFGRKKWKVNIA